MNTAFKIGWYVLWALNGLGWVCIVFFNWMPSEHTIASTAFLALALACGLHGREKLT